MKRLLLVLLMLPVFFIFTGCTKQKDDTTTPTTVKPKVTLMVANEIWVNGTKQQMTKISVRYDGSSGEHDWTDLALSEGFQNFNGNPTYHYAGILPLDEYGSHAIQLFFSGGGMAYWEKFNFTLDKNVYLFAFTNSNRNGAIIQLDGIDAKTISGF